jgi:hypothetical protein
MNPKAKAPALMTQRAFQNEFKFHRDTKALAQEKQSQCCPRCDREVKVPWLVAILYSPSQPVRVVGFCASCAGDLRYASLARQRVICDEIAERIGTERRAA